MDLDLKKLETQIKDAVGGIENKLTAAKDYVAELPSKALHGLTDLAVEGVKTMVPAVANIKPNLEAQERAAMGDDPKPLPTPNRSGSSEEITR